MKPSLRLAVTRAARPKHRLPSERVGEALFLFLAAFLLVGCTSAAKQVATAQNSYDFRLARYLETCQVQAPPTPCTAKQAALKGYEKALHEGATALKYGGSLPLQLKALEAWDKEAAK